MALGAKLPLAIGAGLTQRFRVQTGESGAAAAANGAPEPPTPIPMSSIARGLARLSFIALALGASLRAADAPALETPEAAAALITEPLKLPGIFNTDLPRTEHKSSVRFIFHPHFGDLTRRSHQRVPFGLRWGATQNLELSGEVESYFAHGLGHEKFGSAAGFSGLRGGMKYHWTDWLKPWLDSATGVNVAQPVGAPPADVTDGLRHITPFVTFAHQLEARPDLTVFVGVTRDFVSRTSVPGRRRKNEFADDTWSVTPGFVWHRGAFHYTLETGVMSNAGLGGETTNVFLLRPAVSWDLPRGLTFNSKGRWVFGLGLRATHGPDGNDFGVSGKFRGEFNLKRMLGLARAK